MSDLDTDVIEGFAQLLAADVDAAQNVTWKTDGTYDADETGIFPDTVPATPNRIITLTTYGLGDDAVHADSAVGLQIRTRSADGDVRDVKALDNAIADVLLGRFPMTLPTGIRVQTLIRSSSTSLGQDGNQRWSRVSNYTLGLHHPAPHRL